MTARAPTIALLALCIWSTEARTDDGEAVYQQCVACHQPGGVGIPGMFPPLKDRLAQIAATPEGREYAAMAVIGGLVGTIEIDGQAYVGAMPAQGLSDEKIAAVFNYIITDLAAANSAKKFGTEEIAGIRARNAGQNATPVLSLRSKVPDL